jgi:hypothetical protein
LPENICMSHLNPYDTFLDGQEPVPVISATPAKLTSLAEAMGAEKLDRSPAPGKWSPREILCHLADCEIAFGFRLRQTLAEDQHVIQPFDQDLWARPYAGLRAEDALATFAALRHWNVLLIRSVMPGAASRPVRHPERGAMTFQTIVETMGGHDLNHIAQLDRIAAS